MSAPSKWPLPDTGVRFITPAFMTRFLANHQLTSGCYPTAMGFYPGAVGHRMERKKHDDNLVIYCVSGRGTLETRGTSNSITAGQLVVLPRGLAHAYFADDAAPWTVYWTHFLGTDSTVLLEHLGYRENEYVVDAGMSPTLSASFESLMEVRYTGYAANAFINAANQLRQLLTQLAFDVGIESGRTARGFNVELVQSYMRENLDKHLSLDQLAAKANLSKYHFTSRYKSLTGYSPIKHFLNMKTEYACRLLDSTDLSVQAVAEAVGYDDPLYFSRLFRQIIGRSPRDYRASIRK